MLKIKRFCSPTFQGQKEVNGQKTSQHHSQFYRCAPLPTLSTHPIYPSFRSYHHPPKANKLGLAYLLLMGQKIITLLNPESKASAFNQSLIYLFAFTDSIFPPQSTYFSSLSPAFLPVARKIRRNVFCKFDKYIL